MEEDPTGREECVHPHPSLDSYRSAYSIPGRALTLPEKHRRDNVLRRKAAAKLRAGKSASHGQMAVCRD